MANNNFDWNARISQIRNIAENILNVPLKFLDYKGRLKKNNKNAIAQILEDAFGIAQNSSPLPDFFDVKIELKSTPYKISSNKYVAKERLVIAKINYKNEVECNSIDESHLMEKMSKMLVFFYEHDRSIPKGDYVFSGYKLMDKELIPDEDWSIIKKDWQYINHMIRVGRAHELSESQTYYLSACTKGVNNKQKQNQPNSTIAAKPRAFSLKNKYMSFIVNQMLSSTDYASQFDRLFIQKYESEMSIDEFILSKLNRFSNLQVDSICALLNYEPNPSSKMMYRSIVARMLSETITDLNRIQEFQKAGITVKTIRLTTHNRIKESMSFPPFKFQEIVNEKWETSTLRNQLTDKFLFVIFREDGITREYRYEKSVFWSIPEEILDNDVQKVWQETVKIIKQGIHVNTVNGVTNNNLPGIKYSNVCHVRPHARNKHDTYKLPVKASDGRDSFTKQCFWLGNTFIANVVK